MIHLIKTVSVTLISATAAIVLFTACKKNTQAEVITPTPVKEINYKLVWSDEFDGTTLNMTNWTYQTGYGQWGNEEQENYQPENTTVADGNLQITAKKQANASSGYTSGRIYTFAKREFTYGKIEARMKLPRGQGLWPAFWMLGSNMRDPGIGWPKCGEIDIMETINSEVWISGASHYDKGGHFSASNKINTTPAEYHVYSVEWTKETIKWYLDGKFYCGMNIKDGNGDTDEFHKKFNIILNLAVGGTWPGQVIDDTKLPATMYVDYVRVYQEV